jgi:hypothetical protein
MLVHCDPFEHYATAQYNDVYTDGPSGVSLAIGAFGPNGRYGVRFSGDLAYSIERLSLSTSGAVFIAQGDLRISSAPASTNILIACLLSGTTHQVTLDMNADRTLAVYRGSGGTKTQLGSNSTYVVPLNTFIHVGVKATIANSGGSVVVHVWEAGNTSAQVVLNITGVDTQEGGSATWDGFALGACTNDDTDWANFVVMDGSGLSCNDLLGPADVWALWANPREASALSAWAILSGSDPSAMVDDETPDDDTSYLSEGTQNDQVTVAVDPVPFPTRTIIGAQLYGSVKLTSGSPTVVPIGYESGSPNLGSSFSPTANYTYLMQPYSAMPSGAAFSTAAAFDALQWGLKLTSSATGVRATQIVVALIQARATSRRNLLTGYTHVVSGDDNLAGGHDLDVHGGASQVFGFKGSVIGHRSLLIALDGNDHTLARNGVLEVFARRLGDNFLAMLLAQLGTGMVKIGEENPTGTSCTFSALGAYTHLKIIGTGRGDAVATTIGAIVTFNGDTAGNYDRQTLNAASTTVAGAENLASATSGLLSFPAASASANLSGSGEILIYDYRATTFQKMATSVQTFKTGTASGNVNVRTATLHWRNAAVITSVTITTSSGNFVTGTKFSLYGIP